MKNLFLLVSFCVYVSKAMATVEGHMSSTALTYTPSGYTAATNMLQNASTTSAANSTIAPTSAADVFVNFKYDTSGKNVRLVYTTDDTNPSKTNGTVVNASFSNYADPDRTWKATIPALNLPNGTNVKYVFYISDSDLASSWGRIVDGGGIQGSWTEGDNGSTSFALPITLTKFTATPRNANENTLAWTTATEKDNDYFAVQRSADGDKYDQIGRVQGAGTTATEQNYTFSDMAPLAGINYYRLAAVATNGDIEYSPVVTVNTKRKDLNSFAVVPNHVADIALVKIDASKAMNMEIMLVDQVGRIITRSIYELVKGENAINIDLSSLANGVYFLKAGEETTKLVKI